MPFLTVFTPTYNRAHTLLRTYESLKKQTCRDFEWLVIDDGSSDNTREIVQTWIQNGDDFSIKYFYKENGGLHTGYNLAIENMNDSVLAVCIDSDDYMPPNAVELIKKKWLKEGNDNYGGIIGLDYDTNHKMIGGLMPEIKSINLIKHSLGKYHINRGDKKIVCRTDLYKLVAPQKVFQGEKNYNPHCMHLEIGRKYEFLVLNEEICTVEYQLGGMTASQFKQYYNSPNSFMEIRKQLLSFKGSNFKYKIRQYIHLVAESLLAKRYIEVLCHYNIFYVLFCTLPGILLYFYIKYKVKH